MKILVPVVLALLSASAHAERANKPFNTSNGRTAQGNSPAPAAAPGGGAPGGAAANGPAAAPTVHRAGVTVYGPGQVSRVSSGRNVRGGGGRSAGKSIGFVGARRATGSGAGQGVAGVGPKTAAEEEAPPNYSKPGALIRDTGQLPLYEKTTTGTHTVDAGEIVMNNRKANDIGRAPSLQIGPKDTPPPPNPGTYVVSYQGNGAAANGPTNGSSGSSGSSGSGGQGGGHDNNGSGNNGKDKPGDDDDGHGGSKTHDSTFDDPTGFNAAF